MTQDNEDTFKTGAQLFAEWGCKTHEQKLERACAALMEQVNQLHREFHDKDLFEHLNVQYVDCSCADAYRMGFEALKDTPLGHEIARRYARPALTEVDSPT